MIGDKPFPTQAEIFCLDRDLAAEGVSVHKRANRAFLAWLRTPPFSGSSFRLDGPSHWFEQTWRALHPSADWDERPFVHLAISALGSAYRCRPPVIFGSVRLNPVEQIVITPPELERIHRSDPRAFWEMHAQAVDCIDFWLNFMDFKGDGDAADKVFVAKSELESRARSLLAGDNDFGLPQAVCLIAEMSLKAALGACGCDAATLKSLGHNARAAAEALNWHAPHPSGAELVAAVEALPAYVKVRYNPPKWNAAENQDAYRRALFVASEALRRTGDHRMADQVRSDPSIPSRKW